MRELKPCPFCGGQNIIGILKESQSLDDLSVPFYALICSFNNGGCGASSGYYPTVEGAIDAWNRRAEE